MAYPKDEWGMRVPSPKQRAVLLYGQRLRGLGNVSELIRHLKELGYSQEAYKVENAVLTLKIQAKKEYETERLRLDPEYESPFNRYVRELEEQDKVM